MITLNSSNHQQYVKASEPFVPERLRDYLFPHRAVTAKDSGAFAPFHKLSAVFAPFDPYFNLVNLPFPFHTSFSVKACRHRRHDGPSFVRLHIQVTVDNANTVLQNTKGLASMLVNFRSQAPFGLLQD